MAYPNFHVEKWRKVVTIVDGITEKETDLSRLARRLKGFCACGGTSKNEEIILQDDHRDKVRTYLIRQGYPEENVEILKTLNKLDIQCLTYEWIEGKPKFTNFDPTRYV